MLSSVFFFFNATATTEIYTLSLHDALPISKLLEKARKDVSDAQARLIRGDNPTLAAVELQTIVEEARSEEHTSELQSHSDLVCRLLLEKKKKKKKQMRRTITKHSTQNRRKR